MTDEATADSMKARLKEAEELISRWHTFAGASQNIDYELWREARTYAQKYKLPDPPGCRRRIHD